MQNEQQCICIAATTGLQCLRPAQPKSQFCALHSKKCEKTIYDVPVSTSASVSASASASASTSDVKKVMKPILGKPVGRIRTVPEKPEPEKIIEKPKTPKQKLKKLESCHQQSDISLVSLNLGLLDNEMVAETYGPIGKKPIGGGTYGSILKVGTDFAIKKMKKENSSGVT